MKNAGNEMKPEGLSREGSKESERVVVFRGA